MKRDNEEEEEALQEPRSSRRSLRPRSIKLWDHPEEELPLLASPLELHSETVADALIKRLQDEKEDGDGTVGGFRFTFLCGHQSFDDINSLTDLEQQ